MKVLGIESSCDETGVALIDSEKGLLAHAIHTQIDMHRAYGGVVPELASRDHIRRVLVLADQVLEKAQVEKSDIDAIAVTEGPGLAGALLVGASVAHAIGYALNIPVVGVHHLEGHLLSARLADPAPEFPFIALLVSGGHTQFMRVEAFGKYELLGETLDDAAGEAFDKTAQLLGECYPGGPAVSRLADEGTPGAIDLPRPMLHSPTLDMSFSGLKTAVVNLAHNAEQTGKQLDRAALARDFTQAVVDELVPRAMLAMQQSGRKVLVAAGGVAANSFIRAELEKECRKHGYRLYMPPLKLCGDNGAMIGAQGYYEYLAGARADWSLNAYATRDIDDPIV